MFITENGPPAPLSDSVADRGQNVGDPQPLHFPFFSVPGSESRRGSEPAPPRGRGPRRGAGLPAAARGSQEEEKRRGAAVGGEGGGGGAPPGRRGGGKGPGGAGASPAPREHQHGACAAPGCLRRRAELHLQSRGLEIRVVVAPHVGEGKRYFLLSSPQISHATSQQFGVL